MGGFGEVSSPARAHNILQATGDSDAGFDVFHDCNRLARGASMNGAVAAVVAGMNNAAISQSPYFAVHSGVAAWDEGMVAIPAASGGGKTTLTAALVREGFDYLSDEALAFDYDGEVLPYPKPFAFTPWSARVFGFESDENEILMTPEELAGTTGKPGRLTDLVLSEYGHDVLGLQPLPKSRAVAALIQYSFNHYKDPERAFRIATEVARDLDVWRLEYDDPLEAARLLAETLR